MVTISTPNVLTIINTAIARYSSLKSDSSRTITVYHGRKYWSENTKIFAPAIEYMIGRANKEELAFNYAEGLLEKLTDFSNLSILHEVMDQAQNSGYSNPFVSTTLSRNIARSFATQDNKPGFILTIQGPESYFYDFNGFRKHFGIPQPLAFEWLKEFGIPCRIVPPFELIRVDRVVKVEEEVECIFNLQAKSI